MAKTLYVDPQDAGGNLGTQVDPCHSLQTAIEAVDEDGGNIIYCRGTETLVSGGLECIDFTTSLPGKLSVNGYNRVIGCPANSWTPDGTRFTISGNNRSNGNNGIKLSTAGAVFWWFENVLVDATYSTGFYGNNYNLYSVFINCKANGCSEGFSKISRSFMHKCVGSNNTFQGFRDASGTSLVFPVAYNNGAEGIRAYSGELIYAALSYNNGGDGITGDYGMPALISAVSHNNSGDGFNKGSSSHEMMLILGCRFTNNGGYGLAESGVDEEVFEAYNFINGNTLGEIQVHDYINSLGGTITEGAQGYNDPVNGDFNLTATAAMRDVPITLPE